MTQTHEERTISALHSVTSSEWFSPEPICNAAREAMGGEIDLDPASCSVANRLVKAKKFYSLKNGQDGLRLPWRGRVFHNPPSPPREWWGKAMVERDTEAELRSVSERRFQLCYVAYSVESLQQAQGWSVSMMGFPFCIPKGRVRYMCTAADAIAALVRKQAKRKLSSTEARRMAQLAGMPADEIVQGDSPTHSSAIVAVGIELSKFTKAFRSIGECVGGSDNG